MALFSKLQRHNTENPKQIFPEMKLRGLSPIFHIHVSVSDLNIPTKACIFSGSRIGRPTLGIYKSLTDTRAWKCGLRPYSYSSDLQFLFQHFSPLDSTLSEDAGF